MGKKADQVQACVLAFAAGQVQDQALRQLLADVHLWMKRKVEMPSTPRRSSSGSSAKKRKRVEEEEEIQVPAQPSFTLPQPDLVIPSLPPLDFGTTQLNDIFSTPTFDFALPMNSFASFPQNGSCAHQVDAAFGMDWNMSTDVGGWLAV